MAIRDPSELMNMITKLETTSTVKDAIKSSGVKVDSFVHVGVVVGGSDGCNFLAVSFFPFSVFLFRERPEYALLSGLLYGYKLLYNGTAESA